MAVMAHRLAQFADKAHLDKAHLERVNRAIVLGLIGGGLLACALGAVGYDVYALVRLFSA
jgi:hypothetical protein